MVRAAEPSKSAMSSHVQAIIDGIADDALQANVRQLVELTLVAVDAFGRIHLPQDHFEEGESTRPADDKHLELAPYVLAGVGAINRLLGFVAANVPPPANAAAAVDDDDFDLEFDLVDGPTGDGVGLSHRQQEDAAADPTELVADAVHAFAGMLRSRVTQFAERLKHATAQSDRWPLLAELDDATHKLTKALQGFLFGVLGVFVTEGRREDIFPDYRSAVSEAVALRAAITELSFHIGRFNAALSEAKSDDAVPLVVAVADRLTRFSARPEYRTLRAEDKKAVIDFRATLHALRHNKDGLKVLPLRHSVEGFSKFLEAMGAINHREVLVLHDAQRLKELMERVEQMERRAEGDPGIAADDFAGLIDELEAVYGRNPELDNVRRNYIVHPAMPENVHQALEQAKGAIAMTLMTVG